MKTRKRIWKYRIAIIVALAVLAPAVAPAVEEDRITVEDPATGTVKFKVTSEGNVTGASFTGNGSALTNIPRVVWRGEWSPTGSYVKDDTASYNGSSYIALQPNTGFAPSSNPSQWQILAAKGDTGPAGSQGPMGPQGPVGPQGPAGSPDSQAQILGKIATQADGAVLAVQQGPAEAGDTAKMTVKDVAGSTKFSVQANGSVGIGTSTATYPLTIDSGIATAVPAGVGMAVLSGNSNKERMEIRSFGPVATSAPVIQGKGAQWLNGLPTSTLQDQFLIMLGGSGYDNTGAMVIGNRGMVTIKSEENWTPTAQGTYVSIQTTQPGSTNRTEKVRITGSGNVGIGTTAPTQKLEVKDSGVRINNSLPSASKPACDNTTDGQAARGTIWITQGTTDTVEICVSVSGTNTWKAVTLQ